MANGDFSTQEIISALKNAEAQGRTEDAQKLAVMAKKMMDAPKTEEGAGMPTRFIGRGVAQVLGAPVDVVTAGLNRIPGVDIQEPVLGSESITRGMQAVGIHTAGVEEQPKTTAEFISQTLGEAGGTILPFTKVAQIAAGGSGVSSRVARQVIQSTVDKPAMALAAETGGAVGAGAGRKGAEDIESPVGKTMLEMAGGMTGSIAPTLAINSALAVTVRGGGMLLEKISLPFTEQGARFRAGKVLQDQVADTDVAIAKAGGSEQMSDVKLPPAVATGEKRLISLLKSFRDLDPVVDKDQIDKLGASISKLEAEMKKLGYGSPDVMRAVTQKRIDAIEANLTNKIADAVERADAKVSKLKPASRKSQEAIIVRNELKTVADKEFKAAEEAWNNIDMSEPVSFSGTRDKFFELKAGLSKAELEDIPAQARNSFMFKRKVKSTDTTVREMNGLRKKMSEVGRKARADGDFNKARLAGEIEDSIIDELEVQGSAESLKVAIASTYEFKERFHRGVTGKILGFAREGGEAIDPSLTLDISIGRAGLKGAVDIDKVIVTPEARLAAQRYITRNYVDRVTSNGTKPFDPKKSAQWIRDNDEILDQFPQLRAEFSDAQAATQIADDVVAINSRRLKNLKDPKISTASAFLASDIEEEIPTLLRGANQTKRVSQIMAQARKDKTGEATAGLRGGFTDNILRASESGYNDAGQTMYSGNKMNKFINHHTETLNKVYNPEQMRRLKLVASELTKIEKAQNAKSQPLQIEELDRVSGLMVMGSRVGGAQVGRWVASMTGGGTIQTSGIFSERFKP